MLDDGLKEACYALDLHIPSCSRSILTTFAQYGFTRFLPDPFMEDVNFSRMEVRIFEEHPQEKNMACIKNKDSDISKKCCQSMLFYLSGRRRLIFYNRFLNKERVLRHNNLCISKLPRPFTRSKMELNLLMVVDKIALSLDVIGARLTGCWSGCFSTILWRVYAAARQRVAARIIYAVVGIAGLGAYRCCLENAKTHSDAIIFTFFQT